MTLDDSIIATVEKQSVVLHLEEKEEFTPGHEPKVIFDDSIIATVEKHRKSIGKAECCCAS